MQLAIDTACVASIMACAWVMCRIGTPVRKRLLPRQLWHLALADCTYCFGRLLMPYVQRFLWLTVAAFIVASVGFWASLVVQLQVAVGFGALYCRSGRFMSLLNRTLWLPWAVAVLEVAIVSVLINCGYTESDYYLYEGLFMGCVVGSAFFTYLFCAAFGTFSPHRVSRRADRMVWLFFGASSLAQGPVLCHLLFFHSTFWDQLGGVFASLTSLSDVLMYGCLPMLSSTPPLRGVLASEIVNPNVTMRDPPALFELWAGKPSVRVSISITATEEFEVPRDQFGALLESARGIAELEAERAT